MAEELRVRHTPRAGSRGSDRSLWLASTRSSPNTRCVPPHNIHNTPLAALPSPGTMSWPCFCRSLCIVVCRTHCCCPFVSVADTRTASLLLHLLEVKGACVRCGRLQERILALLAFFWQQQR